MIDLPRALAEHGHAQVRVAGGSMAPTVAEGESVLVVPAAPALGDVVVIGTRDGLLVHRLVARLPGGRWVHAGDCAGALPGVCQADEVLARAELPRRTPPLHARARWAMRAVWRALFLVLLLVAVGCKPKPPPPPPRPEVVEVRVVDRTPPELPAPDVAALTRVAARTIGSSGLPVVDGGSGAPFKLRVEVRLDGAEVGERGLLRAYVVAKLVPVGASPGALSFEQGAVAEREYQKKDLGDRTAAFRAHVERAVEDVVRGVGERAKLARGSSADLIKALSGSDEDLREEAIRIAGERRERETVPALLQLLKSDDRAVRDPAIGALSAIGDPRAVKPLTEVARFRELSELPKVVDALSAIGGDEARAYLEFVSSGHESAEMRELAKEALRHLDERKR